MHCKERPLIAVSACLLGSPIRYDGNHCREEWIIDELSQFVDFYPVCPEMEMGLGTPREEIHLYYDEGDKNNIKLRSKFSKVELRPLAHKTYEAMNANMASRLIDGFILTKKSPSCGLSHVKTVNADNPTEVIHTQGLFAKNICEKYPSVPKIDNGRIKNLELREHFIKGVFAHFRFGQLDINVSSLQDFHKKYKYIMMEHSPLELHTLGKLAANRDHLSNDELFSKYYKLVFEVLAIEATPKKRYNTLMHIMGYFKKDLSPDEKQEYLKLLAEFKEGILNYMALVRYFEFLTKKYKQKYLEEQYYFEPYPKNLKIQRFI